MPEQIRLKVGGVTQPQMAVYEEFARNIPGFLPLSDRDAAIFIPKPVAQVEPPPPAPVTPFQVSLLCCLANALQLNRVHYETFTKEARL